MSIAERSFLKAIAEKKQTNKNLQQNDGCTHSNKLFNTQKAQKWDSVYDMDRVKRIWYLPPMRAANVQASLRIRAVSPEPPLLAHTSSEWVKRNLQTESQIPGPSEWLGMHS